MNRTTGAERYNKKLHKLFANAKILKEKYALTACPCCGNELSKEEKEHYRSTDYRDATCFPCQKGNCEHATDINTTKTINREQYEQNLS